MAKGIDRGQAPPDHPMFSGGPQVFTPQGYKPSPTPTQESDEEALRRTNAEMEDALGFGPASDDPMFSGGPPLVTPQRFKPTRAESASPATSARSATPSNSYDPIEAAMNRHPGLTREKAEEIARAHGF